MTSVRQCLTSSGKTTRVAVLDGGGVRAMFALELFQKLALEQKQPLSNVFHMIVGVSAGALIGAIIALGMFDDPTTVITRTNKLRNMLPLLFEDPNSGLAPWLCPKYKGLAKSRMIHRVIGNRTFGEVKVPMSILCSTVSGEPREFRSWDPACSNILLRDILDATSCAHTYFPPVKVNHEYLADGGVISNKPLMIALVAAIEYFDRGNLWILSIGTQLSPNISSFSSSQALKMGFFGWMIHGLIDIILGARDRTEEKVMTALFANRFLRLECTCDKVKLDDASSAALKCISIAADTVWKNSGKNLLLDFIQQGDKL